MRFKHGDRAQWANASDGWNEKDVRGTVENVNNALEKVYVRWDNRRYGWVHMDDIEPLDAVTLLGRLAKLSPSR